MINTPTSITFLKQSKHTQISFYKRLTDKTNTPISIEQVLLLIKTGEGIKTIIQTLRQEKDKLKQTELKKNLPTVTISGLYNQSRKAETLVEHSGFIQLDFDNVNELPDAIKQLQNDKYTFAAFISPTGTGIKLIVKIPPETTTHISCFNQLEKYYKNNYNLVADKQCKDITRLLFLSWDKDIYINQTSLEWQQIGVIQTKSFNDILQDLQKKETFEKGKRNSFVYKLACDCYKGNIGIDEVLKEAIERFCFEDFDSNEIKTTVQSAYKIKSEVVLKDEDRKVSYSLLKRTEIYLEQKYNIRLNEVSTRVEYKLKIDGGNFKELNENNIYRELQHNNINFSLQKIAALLQSDFVTNYNPFNNYFESLLKWDENFEPNYIENLCAYLPIKDMERFKIQFKKMLVRCIACALENNVFNKQVFVLVGEGQNTGKSTFCRWLCPPDLSDYITEYVNPDKDGLIALSTNFLINMDELATLSKAEINSLKSFISKDKINLRLPFAKRSSVHPRRANFIGSTNNDEFLTDETGSVRWLCFEMNGTINFNYKLDFDINNIWKQAYFLYKNGFYYQLTQNEIKENEEANNRFLLVSQEVQLIKKCYINSDRENGKFVDATDILSYIVGRNSHIKSNIRSIGKALKILGFKKTTKYVNEKGFSVYGYYVEEILN